jgi:hypothetical protein
MQEIVSIDRVTQLFVALAILSPVAGLLVTGIMTAWGVRHGETLRGAHHVSRRWGLLIGLCGPGNVLLWNLYNALTERNGLDTVRNFGINLVVFVLIGIVLGLALNRLEPPASPEIAPPEQPSPAMIETTGEQERNAAETGA